MYVYLSKGPSFILYMYHTTQCRVQLCFNLFVPHPKTELIYCIIMCMYTDNLRVYCIRHEHYIVVYNTLSSPYHVQYYCTGNCSFGMDIWQAGCSVLFMITGRRPWRHLCMDVNKTSPQVTPTIAVLRKKRYRELVCVSSTFTLCWKGRDCTIWKILNCAATVSFL